MGLLYEYAVTPDVFDASQYPHEEVGTARLEYLKDVFLEESLVRNLRDGEWLRVFSKHDRPWHRRGIELLKKLAKQNRLIPAGAVLPNSPVSDSHWCHEAIASHQTEPLTGILSTPRVAEEVGNYDIVGRIDRLGSSLCWTCRGSSVRLARSFTSYETQLRLIMKAANSVMLIDPHLDPTLSRYSNVLSLLFLARSRNPKPLIEIHRVIYIGSGSNRHLVSSPEWETRFRDAWSRDLLAAGLKIEVFIWDDHHDRYLISDLVGIEMGNGYDTTMNPKDITTWSRISRKDRDDIQREFDPASNRHRLKHRFTVP
jgi:hypothetical protein